MSSKSSNCDEGDIRKINRGVQTYFVEGVVTSFHIRKWKTPTVAKIKVYFMLRLKSCSRSNPVSTNTEVRLFEGQFHFGNCDGRLLKGQFHFGNCDGRLCKGQFRFGKCGDRLRKQQTLFRKCDARFAEWATPLSQMLRRCRHPSKGIIRIVRVALSREQDRPAKCHSPFARCILIRLYTRKDLLCGENLFFRPAHLCVPAQPMKFSSVNLCRLFWQSIVILKKSLKIFMYLIKWLIVYCHQSLKFFKKKLRKRFGLYWMKAVLLHSLSGSKAVSRFPWERKERVLWKISITTRE